MTGEAIALPSSVPRDGVLHFLGYPAGHRPSRRLQAMLDRVHEEAEGLVEARGTFGRLAAAEARRIALEPLEAEGLVAGIVTIGPRLEERAAELLREGAVTESLLLDAAGSAAAEEAADRLGALICGDDPGSASHLSCRISPGYGNWPLASQRQIFDFLPHDGIGVSLLPSMLMVPRKSISFAMWLGAEARPRAGLSGCARCGLEHCRYRRRADGKGGTP